MPENGKIPGGFYIKPRRFDESDLAHAAPCVREVWDWLIRNASFQDGYRDGKLLKRGQLFTSIDKIRDGLCWYTGCIKETYTKDQTKKALKTLRSTLRIASSKAPGGTIITICKYDYYQSIFNYEGTNESTTGDPTKAPRRHHEGTSNLSKPTTDEALPGVQKEWKELKEENIYTAQSGRFLSGEIKDAFNQFWKAFDLKKGKAEAADAWLDLWPIILADEHLLRQIIDAAIREAENRHRLKERNGTPKQAAGWLTGRRWEDEQEPDDKPAYHSHLSDADLKRMNQ